MDASDLRRILLGYKQECQEQICKLYLDIVQEPDLDKASALIEFRNWTNEILDRKMEELTNGKRS